MPLSEQLGKICMFVSYDSSLSSIRINYNDVRITIEDDNASWELIFSNFIAFEFHGMWDETILGGIDVQDSTPLIESARKAILERYGANPNEFHNDRSFNSDWFHYTIHLIDGCDIHVVAADLNVIEAKN